MPDPLSKYQPDILSKPDLENLFVGKRKKLMDLVIGELVKGIKSRNPRYLLIVAPRGSGKTHFIALLYHKLKEKERELPLITIKFAEEEYGISRLVHFLMRLYKLWRKKELNENLSDEDIEEIVLNEMKKEKKMFVLLIENLHQLFGEQMDPKDVKKLRGILQKENMVSIISTSPLITPVTSSYEEPFFNFFKSIFLPEFDVKETEEFLKKLAEREDNYEFLQKITKYKAKIRAIYSLTGGFPRVIILLYELMSKENILDVEKAFLKIMDEYTPYYQDLFSMLKGHKRTIMDALIELKIATPKEIAKKLRMDQQTVITNLRRLEKDGYVRSIKIGKSTKYEVREKLFRLWREIRREPFGKKRIEMIIEFLRIWYSKEEIERKFLEKLERPKEALYYLEILPIEKKLQYLPKLIDTAMEKGVSIEDILPREEKLGQFAKMYVIEKRVINGEYEEAINEIDNLLPNAKNKEKGVLYSLKGYILGILGEYEEAIECFNEVLKLNPKYEEALLNKGLVLYDIGEYKKALKYLNKTLEINPKEAGAWKYKGVILGILGEYEEAIECFNEVLKLNPNDAIAWYGKGLALYHLQKYEEAIECYDKALGINPKLVGALFEKALTLEEIGKYEEAIKYYDEVLKLNPNDAETWNSKGVVFGKLGRYNEAIECFDKALEIDPNEAGIWYNKGLALYYLGKYEEALKYYDKALEINPKYEEALMNKGSVLYNLGKYEEALKYFDKTLKINPNQIEACIGKGLTLFNLSIEEFKKENFGRARELMGGGIQTIAKIKDKEETEKTKREILIGFFVDLIKETDIQIIKKAIESMGEKTKKIISVIIRDIEIALKIIENKNINLYYELPEEERDIVVKIVKELSKSDELIPEEYKYKEK